MSTLKICTHDRTQWITHISEIILVESFIVKHFDDPLQDCDAPNATVKDMDIRITTVVDFQAPDEDRKVEGDTIGHVLFITRKDEYNYIHRLVAPARCCFLMSNTGATIDRI
jgi:hypothetical protein